MSMSRPPALTRREALGAALAAGGAVAGGALLGGPDPASSRRASSGATAALNEVLRVERIQASLYAQASDGGALTGELQTFARTVAAQEREHVDVLTGLLGADADAAPRLRFGRATRDADAFSAAARDLEDLATRAYNVQLLHLGGRPLREVLRIVSVEARHAAWIRDVRGESPAPDAVEPGDSSATVSDTLHRTGFLA
jgi:rubrerythrin